MWSLRKFFAVACLFLLLLNVAAAQQLQQLDDTDSLRQRREKTNANFQMLLDKVSGYAALVSGKENHLTFAGTLSRIGDTISCPACVDTSSTQSISNKTLVAPQLQSYNAYALPAGVPAGSLATVSDSVRGLWAKSATGDWYSTSGERVNVKEFGAKGNARHVDDAVMTSGSPALTSATASFTIAVVGMSVTVNGAGVGGATYFGTITSYVSPTVVGVYPNASTDVSSKRAIFGTLDTTAVNDARAQAAGKALYFPTTGPGRGYLIQMTATDGGAVAIPSNTTVLGDGAGSVIYCIGSDGKNGGSSADDDGKACLYVSGSNVRIAGLSFVGENGPFTYVAQNQSNAILVAAGVDSVSIDHCRFTNLFGLPIHQGGAATRVNNDYNYVGYCANGINNNADWSTQTHNHIFHSEGIETSGGYSEINFNLIEYAYVVGISLGGRTSPGDTGPGTKCIGNIIKDSQGQGITLNDGFTNGTVANNTVINSLLPGIQVVGGGFNDVTDNEISENLLINVGSSVSGPTGISVSQYGDRTRVINNRIQTDWTGIRVGTGADSVVVRGNRIAGGFKDLLFDDATNLGIEDNQLATDSFEFSGTGATLASVINGPIGTPSQITTNQDNYDIGIYSAMRLWSDASRNITGFKYGAPGRRLTIVNAYSNNIVLKNQDAGSSAANRIITGSGSDLTLAPDATATLIYDPATARWRVL